MLHTPEADLNRVLETLSALHPKKIDLSLGRMERLLAALGHPEQNLPPVIHVAGTNGKGSVIAFMRAILEAAGHSVHVYTSPHLISFRERIRLAGSLIEEGYLIEVLQRTQAANRGFPITFFEITTAAALLAFSETPADVLLLEVGLGGRLDATNVIGKPLISVITPICLDHAEFLGGELRGVAREKAGIIKPGVPVVSSPQPGAAMDELKKVAKKLSAPLEIAGKSALKRLSLSGPHQQGNAATAVKALKTQTRFQISKKAIETGLGQAKWPARLHLLDPAKFKTRLIPGTKVLLDGGHNPLAGKILGKALEKEIQRPVYAVIGMMANKDCKGFLKGFGSCLDGVLAVPVPNQENGASPAAISDVAASQGLKAETANSVEEALGKIPVSPPPLILITGSLYLAGSVLAGIGETPK